eukprot:GHVP01062987.1.p1 GENE.GHVP01062987.1~~GHVP01062987.1.p1  ORF type:complete len:459 (+),score=61.96 GHVP01062987.1:183-1559(+)
MQCSYHQRNEKVIFQEIDKITPKKVIFQTQDINISKDFFLKLQNKYRDIVFFLNYEPSTPLCCIDINTSKMVDVDLIIFYGIRCSTAISSDLPIITVIPYYEFNTKMFSESLYSFINTIDGIDEEKKVADINDGSNGINEERTLTIDIHPSYNIPEINDILDASGCSDKSTDIMNNSQLDIDRICITGIEGDKSTEYNSDKSIKCNNDGPIKHNSNKSAKYNSDGSTSTPTIQPSNRPTNRKSTSKSARINYKINRASTTVYKKEKIELFSYGELLYIGPPSTYFGIILTRNLYSKVTIINPIDPVPKTIDSITNYYSKRYSIMNQIKLKNVYGLLFNPSTNNINDSDFKEVKRTLTNNLKIYQIINIGRITEEKLANFPEIDVFVVMYCDWGNISVLDQLERYHGKYIITRDELLDSINPDDEDEKNGLTMDYETSNKAHMFDTILDLYDKKSFKGL